MQQSILMLLACLIFAMPSAAETYNGKAISRGPIHHSLDLEDLIHL